MKIKKHPTGNQFWMTPQKKWVRNFALPSVPFIDINDTIVKEDHFTFLRNEKINAIQRYPWIDSEHLGHENVVIVSDGYGFKEKHKLLEKLPKNVAVMGVNGSLVKWESPRSMNYYVANNPYDECMKYLPRRAKTLPKCLASARTNSNFLLKYRGSKYRYYPVNERGYTTLGEKEVSWQVDDYRNAVCAALGLAYRFGAEKILLLCCDDVFAEERAGAVKLHNGLWMYPQHEVAHGLIDGNCYWLKNIPFEEVFVTNHSSGPLYENAEYIGEDQWLSFFGD